MLRPAVQRLRSLETTIAHPRGDARGRGQGRASRSSPRSAGGRCRGWRSRSSRSASRSRAAGFLLDTLGILALGPVLPIVGGRSLAIVGAAFAAAGWWLRRSDRLQRSSCATSRWTAGSAAGRTSSRSSRRSRASATRSSRGSASRSRRRPRSGLDAEEAHVAEIEQRRARLGGLIGDEPPDLLPDKRDAAALEIEQKTSALDALGPIAKEPRARERLEVEVARRRAPARARPRRRGRRPRPGRAEPGRRRGGRGPRRAPRRRGRRSSRPCAPRARLRADAARDQHAPSRRRCSARPATSSGAWSATSRGSPTAATSGCGSTTPTSASTSSRRSATTGSRSRDLSQGTLDVVYLAARLGLVRLVTGDRRPPLVLDDPFVTLDDERAPARAGAAPRGRGATSR